MRPYALFGERSRRGRASDSRAEGPAHRDAAAARRVATRCASRARSTATSCRGRAICTDATVDYVEYLSKNRRTVRNVVGILPGSDPTAREGVDRHRRALRSRRARWSIVGDAGANRRDSQRRRRQRLGHGVDHRDRTRRRRRPRRGFRARWSSSRLLARSAACSDRRTTPRQPRMPIESTIAMLNLDMVGRAHGAVDVSGLEVAPSMEADFATAVEAQRRYARDQARGSRRRAQRRLQLHRPPDSGDQLLHRLPSGLSPPRRRLAKDRCAGNRAGGDAGVGVRRRARQPKARPEFVRRSSSRSPAPTDYVPVHVRRLETGRTEAWTGYEYAGVGDAGETRREGLQPLAQHQPPAMQTRLQRLILHLQPGARFLGRESFDIAQHDRRAIDLRQLLDRRLTALRSSRAAAPRRACGTSPQARHGVRAVPSSDASARPARGRAPARPLARRGAPQPRHRGVERDAINPR